MLFLKLDHPACFLRNTHLDFIEIDGDAQAMSECIRAVIGYNWKPESMMLTPICLCSDGMTRMVNWGIGSLNPAKPYRSIESNGTRPLSYNCAFAVEIMLILLGVILFSLRAALSLA